MNKRPNRWHVAIVEVLAASNEPLKIEQIWERLLAIGFQHKSKKPRATLGGRLAELSQFRKIERVGLATYQIARSSSELTAEVTAEEQAA